MRVSVRANSVKQRQLKLARREKQRIWREKEKTRESESEHARCEQKVLQTSSSATFSCAAPVWLCMAAHRENTHTKHTNTRAHRTKHTNKKITNNPYTQTPTAPLTRTRTHPHIQEKHFKFCDQNRAKITTSTAFNHAHP